jgi:hypothetical protein
MVHQVGGRVVNAIVSHRRDRRWQISQLARGASTITLDQHVKMVDRDDLDAIRGDWARIGGDMRKAIAKSKRERVGS